MDIVERLRLRPARETLYLDGCVAAGYGPTIEGQAADEIERLRIEHDRATTFHATAVKERDLERMKADRLKVERDDWFSRCTEAQASVAIAREERDHAEKERDDAISTAQDNAAEVEKLKTDLAVARALLQEAREEVECWSPDECMANADESEALSGWYALRDRIDAALARKKG